MDPIRVPVWYDFASTISYVSHRVLSRMAGDWHEIGVEFEWRPLDLARMMRWKRGASVSGPRRENALRVARELAVEVTMPAVWLDSRPAGAIALGLDDRGADEVWRERVWAGIYEEGRDPAEPEELLRLGRDVGIDPSVEPDALAQLDRNTLEAMDAGVMAVPTFMLAGLPFSGIQEERTMRSMLERYAKRQRESDSRASTLPAEEDMS